MKARAESKARIVLVDDHQMFREQLAHLINRERDLVVCAEADNVRDGLAAIHQSSPLLVIADISLKGASGLELLKDIRLRHPDVGTLVLSMHNEAAYAARALRAGARGYITKNEASTKLLTAIRTVLAGEIYLAPRFMSEFVHAVVQVGVKSAERAIDRLTDRELEVFELIGRGQTAREIAHSLSIGLTTIDTYRARIKEKLRLVNGTQLQTEAAQWVQQRDYGLS